MEFICLGVTGICIGYTLFKSKRLNKKLSLCKDNRYTTIVNHSYKKNNEYSIDDINIELNKQQNEYIKNFLNTMKRHNCINNFMDNLKNVELVKNSKKMSGYTNINNKDNNIKIYLGDGTKTLVGFHELCHLASIRYDEEKDTYYCGFNNEFIFNGLGSGINEGYTNVVTNRYFLDEKTYSNDIGYSIGQVLSELVEKIVGTTNMENYYFNANLEGLVNDLSNYMEYEEAINVIKSIDTLVSYSYIMEEYYLFNKKNKDKWLEILDNTIKRLFYTLTDKLIKKEMETESLEGISKTMIKYNYEDLKTQLESILSPDELEQIKIDDYYETCLCMVKNVKTIK